MKTGYTGWTNLTLKFTSLLDTEDLWRVPGVAADTLQIVQIILVEDLGKAHDNTTKLSDFLCLYCSWLKPEFG